MHYHFVIIGGGLVGLSLAIALRDTPFSIALIDAREPSCGDPRLFALNEQSCQLLKNLNVWTKSNLMAASIKEVHVSHKGHFGAVHLHSKDVFLKSLGAVIPAQNLESALNKEVRTLSNVTLYQPAKVISLVKGKKITLKIVKEAREISLTADFLIGADGGDSTVRRLAGIPTKVVDYQQTAIVTQTVLKRDHQSIAYERFTQAGAIAMLPLVPDHIGPFAMQPRVATIWTTATEQAIGLMQLTDNDFCQLLQTTFGYRLGRLQRTAKRFTYPLRFIQAEKIIDGNVLLMGNAAHTLHPVTAQGLNLGLYEVASLAVKIREKSTASAFTLQDFQAFASQLQDARSANIKIAAYLPRLLASSQNKWIATFLSAGMLVFDLVPAIKNRFLSQLLGRTKPLPSLLTNMN